MACVASGKFVLSYPRESERCRHQLQSLFFENLRDPIPSVRQGGALAVANLVKAYGITDDIMEEINAALDGVKDQPNSVPTAQDKSPRGTSICLSDFCIVQFCMPLHAVLG